jgi:hypothetical protein
MQEKEKENDPKEERELPKEPLEVEHDNKQNEDKELLVEGVKNNHIVISSGI